MSPEEHRFACWERFKAAADAYLAGDGGIAAKAFLARVRGKYGDEVADRQRKELWGWINAHRKNR